MVIGLRKGFGKLLKTLGDAQQRPKRSSDFNISANPEPPRPRAKAGPPPSEPPGGASAQPDPISSTERTVIEAPLLATPGAKVSGKKGKTVRIKAEPGMDSQQCRLLIDRAVLNGYSWSFGDSDDAAGSPLAEVLFGVNGIESVLLDDTTITLTAEDTNPDWKAIAAEAAQCIRTHLKTKKPAVSEAISSNFPTEDEVREAIQQCIDDEVNPGVAAHSGFITLIGVRGNAVTIEMGGGCQGCSAADLTLKTGIHESFRRALPSLGAIYDETDHAAGTNPYFA